MFRNQPLPFPNHSSLKPIIARCLPTSPCASPVSPPSRGRFKTPDDTPSDGGSTKNVRINIGSEGGYRGPLRSRRYLAMQPSSPPLPLVLVAYKSPAATEEDLMDALRHDEKAALVAKGSSFVYLAAHVMSNVSSRRKSEVIARVMLSRSTGDVTATEIWALSSSEGSSSDDSTSAPSASSASSAPPPSSSRLFFRPHMYEKDKGGIQIVCTHYLEVFYREYAQARGQSPIDLLSSTDRSNNYLVNLLACSNRTVHLQLKKKILKVLKQNGKRKLNSDGPCALVLAVGVVGVDKCLQALAVASKELEPSGHLVVTVEKIAVDIKYEDGDGVDERRIKGRGVPESREGLRTGFLFMASASTFL